MDSQGDGDAVVGGQRRWTCDACGCHTNNIVDNPLSCSICGSGRQIADPLSSLRRSFFGRRNLIDSSSDDTMEEQAAAALAQEVAGLTGGRIPSARSRRDLIRRTSENQMPLNNVEAQRNLPSPEQLKERALADSIEYSPTWGRVEQLGLRRDTGIEIGKGDHQNVAMVPFGTGEGKTVRTAQPLPREIVSDDQGVKRCKVFGFCVSFKRPHGDVGKSLGGGYLVGLTTSGFSSFGEKNGLQQSPLFWGIDDAGNRYEGPASHGSIGRSRRSVLAVAGREAPRNRDGMCFGNSEVITVVVDLELRTMTFWRDDAVLGSLVRSLPRSGNLFPVAVPFNAGCVVCITHIGSDPNLCIKAFEKNLIQERAEREMKKHEELRAQRSILIQDGVLTESLVRGLKTIFCMYSESNVESDPLPMLSITAASRLWYRCGLKLEHLGNMTSNDPCSKCKFEDFLEAIRLVLREDEETFNSLTDDSSALFDLSAALSSNADNFEVGDIVELVEGFEKYGDAARGPMVTGDRGQVVEVQKGSSGERHSIRVLYHGRRWWYQPQTLVSERSKLIDTHGVWFVRKVMRSHGFNELTLQPMWGEQVTPMSWKVGDLVVPFDSKETSKEQNATLNVLSDHCVGRIVSYSTTAGFQTSGNDRNTGLVNVELVCEKFAARTGISEQELKEKRLCRVHRLQVSKLAHAGISNIQVFPTEIQHNNAEIAEHLTSDRGDIDDDGDGDGDESNVGGKCNSLQESLELVSKVNLQAIESISRECERSCGTMAKLFGLGLPNKVLSALDNAKPRTTGDDRESRVLPGIAAVGELAVTVARCIFPSKKDDSQLSSMPMDCESVDTKNEADSGGEERQPPFPFFHSLHSNILPSSSQNSPPIAGPIHTTEEATPTGLSTEVNYMSKLECIRRGGFEKLVPGVEAKRGSVLNAATKSAIINGLLSNNFMWLKRVMESAKKKKSVGASIAAIFNARDEDGATLLFLAVNLGCSQEVIHYLVQGGGTISDDIVRYAAYTGQVDVLRTLLKEYDFVDGVVDEQKCSQHILAVIEEANTRRKAQRATLQSEGIVFLSSLIKKLLQFGISSKSKMEPDRHVYRCVAEVFVGRVLLKAMYQNRCDVLSALGRMAGAGEAKPNADPESRRVPIFTEVLNSEREDISPSALAEGEGLLFVVPRHVLELILSDAANGSNDCATNFMVFVEGLLWSRDVDDVALGLCLTASFLRLPSNSASETLLRRFGIGELLRYHQHFADQILKKSSKPSTVAGNEKTQTDAMLSRGLVLCPKNHPAELHITRHSSFRCDLCGKGVERGFPMHGCRECDWDACEECLNKGNRNIVKWKHVERITTECANLFEGRQSSLLGSHLAEEETTKILAKQIEARQLGAIDEISRLFNEPAGLTLFEFSRTILPALCKTLLHSENYHLRGACVAVHRGYKRQKIEPAGEGHPIEAPALDTPHEFVAKAIDELVVIPFVEKAVGGDGASKDSKARHIVPHSELIRRVHELIAFFDQLEDVSDCRPNPARGGELCGLTSCIEVALTPQWDDGQNERSMAEFTLRLEPLLRLSELQQQLVRSWAIMCPEYPKYCRSLCEDCAIICEQGSSFEKNGDNNSWKLAQIVGFNEHTGVHRIRYASSVASESEDRAIIDVDKGDVQESFTFEADEQHVVLAGMKYFVLHRNRDQRHEEYRSIVKSVLMSNQMLTSPKKASVTMSWPDGALPMGSRVEFRMPNSKRGWSPGTVIGCKLQSKSEGSQGSAGGRTMIMYELVNDHGKVITSVSSCDIQHGKLPDKVLSRSSVSPFGGGSPDDEDEGDPDNFGASLGRIIGVRRLSRPENRDERASQKDEFAAPLKRSWSALSLLNDLSPVDVTNELQNGKGANKQTEEIVCCLPCSQHSIKLRNVVLEKPPEFTVVFRPNGDSFCNDSDENDEMTVYKALNHIARSNGLKGIWSEKMKLQFKVVSESISSKRREGSCSGLSVFGADQMDCYVDSEGVESLPVSNGDSDPAQESPCGEVIFMRCMQLLEFFGKQIGRVPLLKGASVPKKTLDRIFSAFESRHLTQRLLNQIEDPLQVVSGTLPEWAIKMPSLTPRLFAYSARRLLMERAAFGVSRSVMKQQESKVKVKTLRQRMAALRGRAVELVGEAFSGGAEDPTALQLQADELYGMEEALGARVNAAFRAQRWKERALQCVKAAIKRDSLLADAARVMDIYANDPKIRRRRLEIRFEGESGFDAAAGDEAGVTRGFYADVAESLVCVEFVSEVQCSLVCDAKVPAKPVAMSPDSRYQFSQHQSKLPLWIPDSTNGVIIPTPRAARDSGLGLFPRPLSPHDPQIKEVMAQFRFMGRMFASALRDGFMFPLPLSSAFLKLVLSLPDDTPKPTENKLVFDQVSRKTPVSSVPVASTEPSFDEMSCAENTPTTHFRAPSGRKVHGCFSESSSEPLTTGDLPRPGFLGGEIYAVLNHTCKQLDQLDESSLSPDSKEEKLKELAACKNFAREALGKEYDCSFDEFFDGKFFVDPLDPAQDAASVPLCAQGHLRRVTVHNVREWAELAKRFFLKEGVIHQASAFRQGIEDFFCLKYLRLFSAEELQRDICGGGDNVERWSEEDIKNLFSMSGAKGANEALVAVAAIGGEGGAALSRRFGAPSPTIGYLVKTLLNSSPMQRRQFLSFVTSVPIVTPGKIEVVPIVSPAGDFLPVCETTLPRANTCARRLYLPKFDGYESFSTILWSVIKEESRFKGFYEWRG